MVVTKPTYKKIGPRTSRVYIDLCAVPQYSPPDPRNMLCIREDGGEADDATMSVQELRPMMFRPMKSMGNFYGG